MTPEQIKTVETIRQRVRLMREGGASDGSIRAGLILEGWPAAAVLEAMKKISQDAK
jgi:hypothetical protein